MFKVVILLAVIAVIILGLLVLISAVQHRRADWEVREESTGNGIEVIVWKPGQKAIIAGSAVRGDSFNADLAWARAEAKSLRDDLNRGKKILNR